MIKVTSDRRYLTRIVRKASGHSNWHVLCGRDLAKMFNENEPDLYGIEIISYSQLPCGYCAQPYVTPPGRLPNYKMRHVVYVIHADYPEWDMTA